MRINRYLAQSGVASRRGAESLVLEGRVAVNGKVVRELATTVRPEADTVEVDGREVSPPQNFTYWMFHKPAGVVTTAKDPQGRPTVVSYLPKSPRVFPVGRLDQDTSGLLLLTNDGGLSHRLLHPKYHVEKEYLAWVEGAMSDRAVSLLRTGIDLDDGKTAPARAEILERTQPRTRVLVAIREGRNRQVRRMFEAVGHPVIELHRTRFGPLTLEGLAEGSFRELGRSETRALRRAVAE